MSTQAHNIIIPCHYNLKHCPSTGTSPLTNSIHGTQGGSTGGTNLCALSGITTNGSDYVCGCEETTTSSSKQYTFVLLTDGTSDGSFGSSSGCTFDDYEQ